MDNIEERFAAHEARIRLLEDREAIGRLICSWGPACDTGLGEEAASIWTDDGLLVSDMSRLEGPPGVLAMMESDGQQDLIRQGCAHVQGVPQMGEDKGRTGTDQCQMPEDKWQSSRHEFRMAEDECQIADVECQGADQEIRNGEPEAEAENAEKSLPESVTTAKKLQNKANSDFADLKQETESQELRSEATETRVTKQSQFPGGCRTERPGSPGGQTAPQGGQQPAARDMVLDELLAAAAPPLPPFNQPFAPGQTATRSGSQRLSALDLTRMLARLPR